jgi:hypothetical protein
VSPESPNDAGATTERIITRRLVVRTSDGRAGRRVALQGVLREVLAATGKGMGRLLRGVRSEHEA